MRRVNVVLSSLLVGFSAWAYVRLPAHVPTHFNFRGEPTAWGSRSSFLTMPLIALLTVVVLEVSRTYTLRNPKSVNLPEKKRFLALPEHEQVWVLEGIMDMMHYIGTATLLMFFVIEVTMYRAALGSSSGGSLGAAVIGMTLVMFALPIRMLLLTQQRLKEAEQRVKVGGVVR